MSLLAEDDVETGLVFGCVGYTICWLGAIENDDANDCEDENWVLVIVLAGTSVLGAFEATCELSTWVWETADGDTYDCAGSDADSDDADGGDADIDGDGDVDVDGGIDADGDGGDDDSESELKKSCCSSPKPDPNLLLNELTLLEFYTEGASKNCCWTDKVGSALPEFKLNCTCDCGCSCDWVCAAGAGAWYDDWVFEFVIVNCTIFLDGLTVLAETVDEIEELSSGTVCWVGIITIVGTSTTGLTTMHTALTTL